MAGAKLLQPTLTAGELSPSLWGRVDINRYATGLRLCRNWIVRPYGGIENRPGFGYVATAATQGANRVIPFVFADNVSYVLLFGDGVVRFYSGGAPVTPDAETYSAARTYLRDEYVRAGIGSQVLYRSLQDGNLNHTPSPLGLPTAWWVVDPGLQVTSPYVAADLADIRYTQSADVLYLVHPDKPPQRLLRVTASLFQFVELEHKEGPFLDLNADESIKIGVSATQGTVTVTANADIFVPEQVGNLLYIETKNLGQVKPWVVGDRGITPGTQRRSDGKTYTAVTVPSAGTWTETGPRQPVHESGRAWDGGGETKTNGSETWSVGVEWEYTDSGYGVVELTEYGNAQAMTGIVRKRLPQQVVGGLGGASNTWTLSGDGVTRTFTIAGAGYGVYSVTISGQATQPDPNYEPPPPSGGGFDGGGNRTNTTGLIF
jgi:hypothetical protein